MKNPGSMQTIDTIAATRALIARWRGQQQRIAFVPTMGNLHAGHVQLMHAARQHGTRVIASIFVNPLQFDDPNDFSRYPRTLDADLAALYTAGVDALFLPDAAEIYPPGDVTRIHVPGLSEILCGEFRPGHFSGMSTVVCKLFNIVQPDAALFGLKDYQQFRIIQRMVADLALPVALIGVETVRESDGLAMSSRNSYLNAEDRARAPNLYRTLCAARDVLRMGKMELRAVEKRSLQALQQAGFKPDYFSVRRAHDLAEAQPDDAKPVILAAAWLGKARLIDNIVV